VSSGQNKWGQSSGGKGSGNSVSSLFDINFSMPSSIGFQREGHSSFSDHVTESGLTSSGSSGTRNSGNSSNGSTGTPRFSGVFHTSFGINTMSLSSVFG